MSGISAKQKAILLRKQGKTYSDILAVVPVAKSTLSLWLRDVGLSKAQQQRLTIKKRAAQQRGGDRRREMRINETEYFKTQAIRDVGTLSNRELFLIGMTLYWAEGTKKSGSRSGVPVEFSNSDPAMVKLFISWLQRFGDITEADIVLRLHLHEGHKARESQIKKIWLEKLDLSPSHFGQTLYKKHNPKTVRKKMTIRILV